MAIYVVKANGRKEQFQPSKIRRSLLRAGADESTVKEIVERVEKEIYDGIPTRQIFKRVMSLLEDLAPREASCYDLKGAIMRLGPAGFHFETFIAEILKEYGYQTTLRTKLRGKCAVHEIDIIALEKESGKHYFIECKFHNSQGTFIDLKEALYTYARFLDLNNGGNAFDGAWLSCNTKASFEARRYAECIGMKLLCWRYPRDKGLERLIAEKKLYPITILRSLDSEALNRFSRARIMLARDLLRSDFERIKAKTGLADNKLSALMEEAKQICG